MMATAVFQENFINKNKPWDFPGGPVVETPPSNAGGEGSIPGRVRSLVEELRSHMSRGQKSKTGNRNNTVTKFNKDFKSGPHQQQQKIFKKKKKPWLDLVAGHRLPNSCSLLRQSSSENCLIPESGNNNAGHL